MDDLWWSQCWPDRHAVPRRETPMAHVGLHHWFRHKTFHCWRELCSCTFQYQRPPWVRVDFVFRTRDKSWDYLATSLQLHPFSHRQGTPVMATNWYRLNSSQQNNHQAQVRRTPEAGSSTCLLFLYLDRVTPYQLRSGRTRHWPYRGLLQQEFLQQLGRLVLSQVIQRHKLCQYSQLKIRSWNPWDCHTEESYDTHQSP